MFRCFLLLLLCLPPIRTRSGIYVDNGLGQTIMDLEVSEDERLELEARLREFLGIPEGRPRASADPFGRAAPKFLMDVYRSLMEDEDGGRRKRNLGLDLSREEQSAIDVSDLIVTLESVGETFINYVNREPVWNRACFHRGGGILYVCNKCKGNERARDQWFLIN